ncbi:hypothetical protein MUG94_03290 [Arthrobacter gengyunqii]|uniref:Uncharacterized protein n=1 Tax=Arthrobacter gengyunqii TaxID=2886940 RepID=A0A9X1M328_9MICC|nr:hypothetical protein [Arthrobacter gengyunqii]MCC3270106.1 hypothetical protein [Arthrobacter gengyunqii]UOY96814.1 hypothetical protein MUG94_03290 [Arthrobacter gengyunqii]
MTQKASKKIRIGTVITIMGAIVAYLIGSGFAKGQEGLQYFASFGTAGAAGALVITFVLYCYVTAIVLRDGRNLRLQSGNKIFEYYCGKYIGKFFGVFAPLFFFCLYAVMLSGAGATLHEQFEWNGQVGIFAMAVAVLATVMLGLDGLVAILSKLGPLIVALCLIVGVTGIVRSPQGIAESADTLPTIDVLQAAPHWALSGFNFPALGILMLVPFLASLSRKVRNDREAVAGGLAGAITLVVAVAVVAFGLLANIGDVYDKQIPMLWIADQVFSGAAGVYSVILFAGIYTTAVPLLWAVVNRVETNDKSNRAKLFAFIATVIAVLLAQVPFAELVNFLYPVAGYLGLVLLVGIVVRHIRNFRNRKQGTDLYAVEFERLPEEKTAAAAK